MKFKYISAWLLAFVLIASVMTGCGGGSYSYASQAPASSAASIEAEYYEEDYAYAENAAMGGGDAPDVEGRTSFTPTVREVSATNRMIITTVSLYMQTVEFDLGIEKLEEIVASYGGFIQDSYVEGQSMFEKYGTRSANFTARIPSGSLDEFVGGVGGSFHVTSKQQSGQDITESYHDNEARLNSLKIQEKQLLEMMEEAQELQYLIEVQRELSNVQYQIDSYTSSKLRMENQVSMSTVHLYLSEVIEYDPVEPVPATFGEKLNRTFLNSMSSFAYFVQEFILSIIWIAPFLVFLGVMIGAVIAIVMFATRKRRLEIKRIKLERERAIAERKEASQPKEAPVKEEGKE